MKRSIFLYALVGSMQYGKNTRTSHRAISTSVTILACVALLEYAHAVLA